ncbi:tRNA-splicing ligase [Parcubacteria bacterium SG8_24]|nr:MAG: tRNA-splicing ligase [Parcubacteria bacterium SG8_24]
MTLESRQLMKQIAPYLFEIPVGSRPGMRVPARFYVSKSMLDEVATDRSIDQLLNVSTLPGVVRHVLAMPDMHEGYGFPIGGVAATELPHGVVSPGGVGYDINCGVRLLLSDKRHAEVRDRAMEMANELARAIPSGTGRGGRLKVTDQEMEAVLREGAAWCVKREMGRPEDLPHIEASGAIPGADPAAVSSRAKARGRDQLGTLGSGNHFLEVQRVDEIFDEEVAEAFGIFPDQIAVAIHCGSRGLGHQVCTDYVRTMLNKLPEYGFDLPDKELACAPADSPEGRNYLAAMNAAANYAFANRQVIMHHVRIEWQEMFGAGSRLDLLYDVAHNMAKEETYEIDGQQKRLLIHRKGATRAFGPGHPEIPEAYRQAGQPVLIPGTMGTASYVLCGTEQAMRDSFGTVCHGAGRRMSRHAAKRAVSGKELRERLESQGIAVKCYSDKGLAEEAPRAYKDVEEVVDVVEQAGLSRRVARLKPVAVIKGE